MGVCKIILITLMTIIAGSLVGQTGVGINSDNSNPDASAALDVKATDQGVLLPRVALTGTTDATTIVSPALSLLVYNTATVSDVVEGYYYFNGTIWVPFISTASSNTLDEAYDEGGAGAGRSITADAGAVEVGGTEGFVVTGTFSSGTNLGNTNAIPSGAGTKMFFYPKKGAFRAGRVTGTEWDNGNIGNYSVGIGRNVTASGDNSITLGRGSAASELGSIAIGETITSSGSYATAIGSDNTASGNASVSIGRFHTSSGTSAVTLGRSNTASGISAAAIGRGLEAPSYGEMVMGYYNTTYTPSDATAAVGTDRLFVLGNGTNTTASDALVILKSGNTALNGALTINNAFTFPVVDGTTGQVLSTDGAGNVSWSTSSSTSNTLDEAYDEGGAGVGRTITADAGAVAVTGTEGLVITGTHGTGTAIGGTNAIPSGAGTKMFFYPKKSAFRAGAAFVTEWDDSNIGEYSTAIGGNTTASGSGSTAMGASTIASGQNSTAIGQSATASGQASLAINQLTTASGIASLASGLSSVAYGDVSSAIGVASKSFSYAECVIGAYNTTYIPASASSWDVSDRLFVVGNGIATSRSDALIIYKNGNTALNGALTINNAFTFPVVDGTTGQVLSTDGAGNISWSSSTSNTLDKAYDQGGAGAGRTITADAGAVAVAGTEGFVITGTHGSGTAVGGTDAIPSGAGTKMFFYPRKSAFRAGYVSGSQWDDASIGTYSMALGRNNTASGSFSSAIGINNTASGSSSFVGGTNSTSSGNSSVAFGSSSTASGGYSIALGIGNTSTAVASVSLGGYNNVNGSYSSAIGRSNTINSSVIEAQALGKSNTCTANSTIAIGESNTASGGGAVAIGYNNTSQNTTSIAIGSDNSSTGSRAVAIGVENTVSGSYSMAYGYELESPSYGEVAVGYYNTSYTPVSTILPSNSDRLFVVGNGSSSQRSNALVLYKNGNTELNGALTINNAFTLPIVDGNSGEVLTTDGAGNVSWSTGSANTLDAAYDQGGSGIGRSITADNGAVAVTGTDGFYVTGTYNSGGAIGAANNVPEGSGARMFFNPKKAAFRAGYVSDQEWDDANVGNQSIALGYDTHASGEKSLAIGNSGFATGVGAITIGPGTASGAGAIALNSGTSSGVGSFTVGSGTEATNSSSIAMGVSSISSGAVSFALGLGATAPSFCEFAIGLYNTTYTPVASVSRNDNDRLFVVGNGSSTSSRSNALVIWKNGQVQIGGDESSSGAKRGRLTILGQSGSANVGTYKYINNSSNSVQSGASPTSALSLYADGAIAGTQVWAHSDARIKENFKLSNHTEDLNTLMDIKITDYSFKDKATYGFGTQKKVVAQELKEVYPVAVDDKNRKMIPNIMQHTTIKDGWFTLDEMTLKIGDRVRIAHATGSNDYSITEVANGQFKVNHKVSEEILVYGTEVNDFHIVDYDALTTLNISATQAQQNLIRQQQKEINELKTAVNTQKIQISALLDLKAEVENLKQVLNSSASLTD